MIMYEKLVACSAWRTCHKNDIKKGDVFRVSEHHSNGAESTRGPFIVLERGVNGGKSKIALFGLNSIFESSL